MRIWKFPLEVTDRQTLTMPAPGTILTVQTQIEEPQLWALCSEIPGTETVERTIAIYGTGNPLPDDPGKYIATFKYGDNGRFIFHAFELNPKEVA
jgi:hypothetical protein